MPRCYRSLALAASSNKHSSENRLTEVYATVLEANRELARRVLGRVNLPWPVQYRVFTQETLPVSGKIDLILRGFDASGKLATVLYAEHKEPGGPWQTEQPEKYLRDLARETCDGAEGRLLVVVGSSKDVAGRVRHRARSYVASAAEEAARLAVEQPNRHIVFTTWQELGGLAEDAGLSRCPPGNAWREAAATPDAPAAQRILLELIWYLEEEGYAVTKPLTKEHLAIYHQAVEMDASIEALIAGVSERLTDDRIAGFRLEKPKRLRAADAADRQTFLAPARSWVARYEGTLYLGFDEEPDTDRARQGFLAACAVVELPKRHAERLRERASFMNELNARELQFDVVDHGGYCWAKLPATDLLQAATLEAQTERLSTWAKEAFARVLTLKPGPRPRHRAKA